MSLQKLALIISFIAPSVSTLSRCERKQGGTSLMQNNSISAWGLSKFLHADLIIGFWEVKGRVKSESLGVNSVHGMVPLLYVVIYPEGHPLCISSSKYYMSIWQLRMVSTRKLKRNCFSPHSEGWISSGSWAQLWNLNPCYSVIIAFHGL